MHLPSHVPSQPPSTEQIRHQRRTALLGAALVAPFALVDLAQGGSPAAMAVAITARLGWVLSLLAGAALLSRPIPRTRSSTAIMSGTTAAAVVVIVIATGGTRSGYFAFLLALPFCMLVLLPGQLVAAAASGGVGVVAGGILLLESGGPIIEAVRWTATGVAFSALAVLATRRGGALFRRELEAARARSDTLAALAASERRRALAERLASVGRLAAGVAHEINNPLGFVKANLAFVRERLPAGALAADAEIEAALSEAELGVERIRRIVADMRGFAREESDELCGTALAESVDEALRLASLRARRISVRTLIPAELPSVRMCRRRIVQVLVNLLVNGADAVDEAGGDPSRRWISVVAEEAGDEIAIRVADGGSGIPEHVLPHVFEPFFTTKAAGSGMGLGLALSQEYVSAAGGRLTAANAPGGGAVFEMRLAKASASSPDSCRARCASGPDSVASAG